MSYESPLNSIKETSSDTSSQNSKMSPQEELPTDKSFLLFMREIPDDMIPFPIHINDEATITKKIQNIGDIMVVYAARIAILYDDRKMIAVYEEIGGIITTLFEQFSIIGRPVSDPPDNLEIRELSQSDDSDERHVHLDKYDSNYLIRELTRAYDRLNTIGFGILLHLLKEGFNYHEFIPSGLDLKSKIIELTNKISHTFLVFCNNDEQKKMLESKQEFENAFMIVRIMYFLKTHEYQSLDSLAFSYKL